MRYYAPTGLLPRVAARILDNVLLAAVYLSVANLIFADVSFGNISDLSFQLLAIAYFTALPVLWKGHSIGKKICRAKIISVEEKDKLNWKHSFWREVIGFQLLSIVTFGISQLVSGIMIIFRKDKKGIHDLIGKTQVRNDRPQGIFLDD
ncbi:MAG: RDD family protein [Alkalicoccus sp.]|nr:MAG: RDD family protein [Alkalicoccus sp.]